MKRHAFISPRSDTVLSPEIRPNGAQAVSDTVFLTGATGFLGAHVLAELLRTTDRKVVCLVRAEDDGIAAQRIAEALTAAERDCPDAANRVTALRGDLAAPDFGLTAAGFAALAATTGAIIHCAAEVSWIKPYRRLRGSHVTGTLNIIRLACAGAAKPLHFVSSLATCYVPGEPETVDETADMSAHLERIPLGYAQAKCVAESLLRQAAGRGLPVSILRCGLICGDSVSGTSNHDDLISLLLRGTVQSGIAADVDWGLDCVPVNTVAQTLRALTQEKPGGLQVLHLHHDEPRQWREMVLWLRLNGYAVRLVPLEEWLKMVGDARSGRAPGLHVLRSFFLARPSLMGGRSLTELYLEPKRRCIRSLASHARFDSLGLTIPRLDAHLLNRYLARYQQLGFLPGRRTRPEVVQALPLTVAKGLGIKPEGLAEFHATPLSGSGVLSELSTVSSGGRAGLWRCHLHYRRAAGQPIERMDAVLKLRSTDSEQDAATLAVAELCSPRLAEAFRGELPRMAYRNGLAREIAIAQSGDSRITRYMPRSIAVIPPDNDTRGGLLEEFLDHVELLDSADTPQLWRNEHIEAAVRALGHIHSVWYRREDELLRQPWLAPGADNAPSMQPLWRELANFSAARFSQAAGEDTRAMQHALIDELEYWWPQWLNMPRCLIHNDFNPRNLAFRRSPQGPILCAYDWELATIGLPQYDLAELLCFVLPPASVPQDTQRWIDLHRHCLEKASGRTIPAGEWQTGYTLTLRYYMLNRLPLYAIIDRFKPQHFLPRVVRNWLRMYRSINETR